MLKLFYLLFGNHRTFSFDRRLFNCVSLLNGVTNIAGSVAMLITLGGDNNFIILWQLYFGIIFIFFFYLSRFHKGTFRFLYWPFVVSILSFLAVNIVYNDGLSGGAHYYLIPALIISFMLSDSWPRIIGAGVLFLATSVGLIVIEMNYPQIITRFVTQEERLQDVAGNLIFVQFFSALLVLILSKGLRNETEKSDRLLRSILPEEIAEQLKLKDRVIPVAYGSATVIFTDFIGFTKTAAEYSPQELIDELDECFSEFDLISEKYNLEKIKTIGDSYMSSGGVPVANNTHAVDCVMAALEYAAVIERKIREREEVDRKFWSIRIGIHTGDLIAGVIGREKFAYDVWGDTVNTASRLESAGASGKVNISQDTYDIISDFFTCTPRGPINVKGKGEIHMYFVEGIKPEMSWDGTNPNQEFKEAYQKLADSVLVKKKKKVEVTNVSLGE